MHYVEKKNNAVGLPIYKFIFILLEKYGNNVQWSKYFETKRAYSYKIVITVWKAMLTLTNNADHGPTPYIC